MTMEPSAATVNARIVEWISGETKRLGMQRSAIAAALGLAPSAITRIFAGERQVSIEELVMLSKLFGDSAAYLRLLVQISDPGCVPSAKNEASA